MYDLDKNKPTNVANRAHMLFKIKVDTPMKPKDMLIKGKRVLEL